MSEDKFKSESKKLEAYLAEPEVEVWSSRGIFTCYNTHLWD